MRMSGIWCKPIAIGSGSLLPFSGAIARAPKSSVLIEACVRFDVQLIDPLRADLKRVVCAAASHSRCGLNLASP
jgi:hypothetical protein